VERYMAGLADAPGAKIRYCLSLRQYRKSS
jgi:hypothetical protein